MPKTSGQIGIIELLRDPEYKKYFMTVPKLPPHYAGSKPWRLYVLLKGQQVWKMKRFETYKEAFKAFKKLLPKIADAAINCAALTFRPPIKSVKLKGKTEVVRGKTQPVFRSLIWRPQLDADLERHEWCSYCRRPTVFKVLSSRLHTGNGHVMITDPKLRCTICSASEDIINLKHPEKEQAWDSTAPTLYTITTKR